MAAHTEMADGAGGNPPEEVASAEGRRHSVLPGMMTVIAALVCAAVSFVILVGLGPIAPTNEVMLTLIGINVALILLLVFLIGREVQQIALARRRGKAASRLHVRIVTLFSLIAAVPAIIIAIVASITLDIGLDRWFEVKTKAIVSSSLSIAEAYIQENARNLQGTTLSMAIDLDQRRSLYGLDRIGFQALLTQQAVGRALAHAALIDANGNFIMQADPPADFDMPEAPAGAVEEAADGRPVLLPDQDRRRWDPLLIRRGLEALEQAEALGGVLGPYALQAAIAACHARAAHAEQTDWARITALYDALMTVAPTPVVALNRAVAVAMAFGPEAGLPLVDALGDDPAMQRYPLLPAVRGDLLCRLQRFDEAREAFLQAAALTRNQREQTLMMERAAACRR